MREASASGSSFRTVALVTSALGGEGAERRRLESVLRSATAHDPAKRYASVAQLVGELIPALRALPAEVGDPEAPTSAPVVTKTILKR